MTKFEFHVVMFDSDARILLALFDIELINLGLQMKLLQSFFYCYPYVRSLLAPVLHRLEDVSRLMPSKNAFSASSCSVK